MHRVADNLVKFCKVKVKEFLQNIYYLFGDVSVIICSNCFNLCYFSKQDIIKEKVVHYRTWQFVLGVEGSPVTQEV